jgi:hypothetical protein
MNYNKLIAPSGGKVDDGRLLVDDQSLPTDIAIMLK